MYKTFITASECSIEQHTFIAKLSRVFRKVNDDITSYKINYNTIQNRINSSFRVTGNDLCTVNSSVSGFLWLDKQSVRWFTSEITSSLHRAIVLAIWRERRGRGRGREREGEGRRGGRRGGREREGVRGSEREREMKK